MDKIITINDLNVESNNQSHFYKDKNILIK